MFYKLKFYYYMNHVHSNVYKILPIDNNKLIIYIVLQADTDVHCCKKMDAVLCDNKHILTHP